jgi:hypothetical protein
VKPRQLYIQDPSSHRIRLTRAGLDKYAPRFAQAGFRACEIRTLDELKEAIDASFNREMAKLATTARGCNSDLDQIMGGLPGWGISHPTSCNRRR